MSFDTFTLFWRGANALVALIALILYARGLYKQWRVLGPHDRFYAQALGLFLGITVWASVENALQNNPVGVRVALLSVAVAWVLFALLAYPPGRIDSNDDERSG